MDTVFELAALAFGAFGETARAVELTEWRAGEI